jgi:hypothetical protein
MDNAFGFFKLIAAKVSVAAIDNFLSPLKVFNAYHAFLLHLRIQAQSFLCVSIYRFYIFMMTQICILSYLVLLILFKTMKTLGKGFYLKVKES